MKKSAFVGEAVENLMNQEELNGEQLGVDLNISRQLGSHIKHNRRAMQHDVAKDSMKVYDNAEYNLDILHEFSEGFTSPVLRGKNIERHRLVVEAYAEQEITEALQAIKTVSLAKPPSMIDAQERSRVEKMMDELLEARIFIDNLCIQIQNDYGISMRKQLSALKPTFKARGLI